MGGFQFTELEIRRERAENLRLRRELTTLQAQVADIRRALARALKSATDGIRSTFAAESEAAERWIQRADAANSQGGAGTLKDPHAAMTTLVSAGETTLRQLLYCFSNRGDKMAEDLARRIVAVRSSLVKHQTECRKWFAADVSRWQQDVERASRLHDDEHYPQAESLLDTVEQSIRQCCDQAVELTKQQQSRDYLLKAVRQVCCNMGLREVEPPRLEHPEAAESRVLLTVGSADKGKLRFALSLEGIQSLGEGTGCKKDLHQFSELLSSGFAIKTKFDGLADDDPRLDTAGGLALPDADEQSLTGLG